MDNINEMIKKFISDNHFSDSADKSVPMAIFEFDTLLTKLDLLNKIFDGEQSRGKEIINHIVNELKVIKSRLK